VIFSLAKYKGVCEKINIAIGVIFTAHRAARCGILFFVQKMCVDFHAYLFGVTHMRQEFTVCEIKSHFSIVCRFYLFSFLGLLGNIYIYGGLRFLYITPGIGDTWRYIRKWYFNGATPQVCIFYLFSQRINIRRVTPYTDE